jgi:hypothetical protein
VSAARTPRQILFETLRDLASKHGDSPKVTRAIQLLASEIKTDADARIALLGWQVGVITGALGLAAEWQQPILSGLGSKEGGGRGAVGTHGTLAERAAKIERAKELYSRYSSRSRSGLERMPLCALVGKEMGYKPATIAKWVPNPNPTRRGRPRKH